jgi:hypothetical protein
MIRNSLFFLLGLFMLSTSHVKPFEPRRGGADVHPTSIGVRTGENDLIALLRGGAKQEKKEETQKRWGYLKQEKNEKEETKRRWIFSTLARAAFQRLPLPMSSRPTAML